MKKRVSRRRETQTGHRPVAGDNSDGRPTHRPTDTPTLLTELGQQCKFAKEKRKLKSLCKLHCLYFCLWWN